MSETLTEFPAKRRGRPPLYDWESWIFPLEKINVLREGRDYKTSRVSFRALCHRAATSRGLKATTRMLDTDDGQAPGVAVLFYDPENRTP